MAVDGPINKGDKLYKVQLAASYGGGYFEQPVFWEVTAVGGGEYYLILSFERHTVDGQKVNEGKQKIQRHVVQGQYWRSLRTAVFAAIQELQTQRKNHERSIERGQRLEFALEAIKRDFATGVAVE